MCRLRGGGVDDLVARAQVSATLPVVTKHTRARCCFELVRFWRPMEFAAGAMHWRSNNLVA
jgi:hypothetical protein